MGPLLFAAIAIAISAAGHYLVVAPRSRPK